VQIGEEKLEKAVRAAYTRGRDQARRLRWNLATAASYAVDTLFLGLLTLAGTVPGRVPLAYGAAAALISVATYGATASGLNLRLRDPSLTAPLTGAAVALQLAVVAMAPQIAFPMLANLFTVFAFGMMWMSLRQSLAVWTLGALAIGALFYAEGERFGMPVSTALERGLVWGYFSLVLGRCLVLSVQANDLRRRLARGRSDLAASLEQMRQLAGHDELTRALNRRSLMSHLEQARARAERGGESFSVALLDLDHFKVINDTHGHATGDEVLRGFVKSAHACMRDTDVFGRYGGEEFMLILGASAPAGAVPALERLRAAFAARDWSLVAESLRVTVSAGVAGHRRGETVAQLLARADSALYEAKNSGRDRVVIKE
jgi:diguanylate cyclase